MSTPSVIAFSGNLQRPSRTRSLLESILAKIEGEFGLAGRVYDLVDLEPSLGSARNIEQLEEPARSALEDIVNAKVLVVGSPTYKGSYTGLFKHAIDLLDPLSLQAKPVILTATGGSDRHSLVVEHQLRPLFGFFMAHTLPTGIYAANRDFTDYRPSAEGLLARIDQAVGELRPLIATNEPERRTSPEAAE